MRFLRALSTSACACLAAACAAQPVGPPPEPDLSGIHPQSAEAISRLLAETRSHPDDAGKRADLGVAYELSGMLRAAEQSYRQAVALQRDEPRWHYYLAIAQARRGRLDSALRAMRRVQELEPTYLPAHLRQAGWLLDSGAVEEARRAFERSLELQPGDAAARLGLARAHLRSGNPQGAIELLEGLVAERDHPYYVQMLGLAYRDAGDVGRAARMLGVGSPTGKPPGFADPWHGAKAELRSGYDAKLRKAEALLGQQRYAEAIELLHEALDETPDNPILLMALARAYSEVGRPGDQAATLQRALQARPNNVDVLLRLSEAFRSDGDLAQALRHVERAIVISPALGAAHALRGRCLIDAGRLDEARASIEAAMRHDPRNPRVFFTAGVLGALSRDWPVAVERLERAVRLDPSMAAGWVGLAGARVETGDLAGAGVALERARALDPGNRQLADVERRLAARRAGGR